MKKEVGLFPKKWEVKKYSELLEASRSISYGVLKPGAYEYDGVPLIRIVDIKGNKLNCNNLHMISRKLDEEYKRTRLHGNELLISLVGTIGVFAKAAIKNSGYNVHRNIGIIPIDEENYSKDYMYYASISEDVQKRIKFRTTGGNQPLYNLKDLNQLEVVLPPLPEQKKIAKILSTVDNHIDEVDGMIEDLKELKKGLMQKLLTEGIGHTEFKDSPVGRIPVEWEVSSLGKHVNIKSGQSPSKFEICDDGEYPFFKVNDMNFTRKYLTDSKDRFNNINNVNLMIQGMVVFPKRGASIFTNKIAILDVDSYFDTNLMGLTCNDSLYNEFLFYSLMYIGLAQFADTTSIPQINNKHIIPLGIAIPPYKEQVEIVRALSGLDNQIDGYINQKSNIEVLKRGLMQQLLTGKTRVKID